MTDRLPTDILHTVADWIVANGDGADLAQFDSETLQMAAALRDVADQLAAPTATPTSEGTDTHHVYLPVCVPMNMDQGEFPPAPYVDFDGTPWSTDIPNVWDVAADSWVTSQGIEEDAVFVLSEILAQHWRAELPHPDPVPVMIEDAYSRQTYIGTELADIGQIPRHIRNGLAAGYQLDHVSIAWRYSGEEAE